MHSYLSKNRSVFIQYDFAKLSKRCNPSHAQFLAGLPITTVRLRAPTPACYVSHCALRTRRACRQYAVCLRRHFSADATSGDFVVDWKDTRRDEVGAPCQGAADQDPPPPTPPTPHPTPPPNFFFFFFFRGPPNTIVLMFDLLNNYAILNSLSPSLCECICLELKTTMNAPNVCVFVLYIKPFVSYECFDVLFTCRGVGWGVEGSRLEAWMKSHKSEVAIT